MIDFAMLALEHVSVAVFHAVVHIAGHESFESAKLRLHKRILRNHDVTRALRESFVASVGLMEKRYFGDRWQPDGDGPTLLFDTDREAHEAFVRLKSAVERFIPQPSTSTEPGEEALDLVRDPTALTTLADVILDHLGDAPPEVRRQIREQFAETFRYAFTEIGIKRNEAVRSVITLDLLSSLTQSSMRSEIEIQHLREAIQVGLASLDAQEQYQITQSGFNRRTTETLDSILDGVTSVVDLQNQLITISQRLVDTVTPAAAPITYAWVLISDDEGNRLAQGRIQVSSVTVGRDSSNSISLPHRLVSRRHTKVDIAEGKLIIEDLGTRNGTFLNGDPVYGQALARFGDQLRIGPYLVEFRNPAELLEAAPIATAPADSQPPQ
jgi:hypothetical protein